MVATSGVALLLASIALPLWDMKRHVPLYSAGDIYQLLLVETATKQVWIGVNADIGAPTPTGLQRRRARVAVRLRVTARDDEATLGTARLISGDDQLRSDRTARRPRGDLLDPIPAGESDTGELRFETTGALTDRLADQKRATLRIGKRSLSSA